MSQDPSARSSLHERLEVGLRAAFGRAPGEVSVLESVSRIVGGDPRVLLREELDEATPAPLVEAGGRDGDEPVPSRGSYHVLGRLGSGGMGEVLKAHDMDLGRDVALKVLRDEHRSDPALLRRFVEEAQVGGQLQHPGIVPVYELGLMADQRPYFTMRLVKGRTLAALLKARRDPDEDRRRFLAVFEDVCQAVAYAHSRGVVHRDLKPANVMVGAYGEVQVVDWGLAKILRKGDHAAPSEPRQEESSRVETVRSRPGSSESDSIDGAVIGTPVCMAPEQARGQVERVDERADVFALGAILAQILTGRPLYRGSAAEVLALATRADLGPMREALATCGSAPELAELCLDCLQAELQDRPADAGVVARRLHDHLEAIEARSRAAQIEAAEARVRVAAERRARKLTVGLAVCVLVAVLAVGGGWAGLEAQAAERARERAAQVDTALGEAQLALGREQWSEAVSAARRVMNLAGAGAADEALASKAAAAELIASQADQAARAERLDEQNRALLASIRELRQPEGDAIYPTDWAQLDAAFSALFESHGLVVEGRSAQGVVESLRARGIPVELAAALDEWALVRRRAEDPGGAARLSELADELDPDAGRTALRRAIRSGDVETLRARAQDLEGMPVGTVRLLGQALAGLGSPDEAIAVFRHGVLRWADELALQVGLARVLSRSEPERALRHYTAALALHPDSVEVRHEMGIVLADGLEEAEEALEVFHGSTHLLPDDAHLHLHVAWPLLTSRQPATALVHASRALEADPDSALAHWTVGWAHEDLGDLERAIAAYRRATELAPKMAEAHLKLGSALLPGNDPVDWEAIVLDEAIEHLELAVELEPRNVVALNQLGLAYNRAGRWDEAMARYREALEVDAGDEQARLGLGDSHRERGDWQAALDCYWTVVERIEDHRAKAGLLNNIGVLEYESQHLEEALEAYRQALDLESDNAWTHAGLGIVLREMGETEEAVHHLEIAEGLDRTLVRTTSELGLALLDLGRLNEARAALERHVDIHPCLAGEHDLAIVHRRLGDLEEAELRCRRAIAAGGQTALAHAQLADVLNDLGRHEEALVSHLRSVEVAATPIYPHGAASPRREAKAREAEAWCHTALSWFLSTTRESFFRDPEEAERRARRALELCLGGRYEGSAWAALGAALYRQLELEEAVEHLVTGVDLAQARRENEGLAGMYQLYLAMALHRSGQPEAAREHFEKALTKLGELSHPYPDLLALRDEAADLLGVGEEPRPSVPGGSADG